MKRAFKLIFSLSLAGALMLSACEKKGEESTGTSESTESSANGDSSEAKKEEQLATTQISFAENSHNFGKINEGEIVEHTFVFKNTGTAPLIIRDAKASCGCTIPEWTKEPVQPGQEGKLEVKYNSSGKEGKINKTVTVFANTEPAETKLEIEAEVLTKKNLSGPFKNQ